MLDKLRTLTGVPANEIAERLRVPFDDPAAYKEIRGGAGGAAGLTDIETAWMLERVNEVFGPYGLGWVLDWQVHDMLILEAQRPTVMVRRAEFRFVLLDEEGKERSIVCPTTGASTNEPAFALKGMETSCIGNALSKLRFQEDVYKGRLGHKNARERLSGQEARPGGGNGSRAPVETSGQPTVSFIVPMGKHKGKVLSELPAETIRWYAEEMRPSSAGARKLQQEARGHIERTRA